MIIIDSYPQFKYMETSCITIRKKTACVKEKLGPFPLQKFMVPPLTKRNAQYFIFLLLPSLLLICRSLIGRRLEGPILLLKLRDATLRLFSFSY